MPGRLPHRCCNAVRTLVETVPPPHRCAALLERRLYIRVHVHIVYHVETQCRRHAEDEAYEDLNNPKGYQHTLQPDLVAHLELAERGVLLRRSAFPLSRGSFLTLVFFVDPGERRGKRSRGTIR